MKKTIVLLSTVTIAALALFSCGDKPTGAAKPDAPAIGIWTGDIPPIPGVVSGVDIFANIKGPDSSFLLTGRDPSRGTAAPIKDTTLVLEGKWRLNSIRDTILLICDTCRIIDTAQGLLVPRMVRGEIIPVNIDINTNPGNGAVEWKIRLSDFVPLAPLLGIDLSNLSTDFLGRISIILTKA